MLDFQRIHFSKKKALEMHHFFAQPNCGNKSFELDHQISSKRPIRRFSNSDHQFFGSLKSKGRWLFRNNKSSVKIFWFQALWKPRFKNKRNFWINCVCTKAFHVMIYLQGSICIHCIPIRGHLHHSILPSGHSHHSMHKRTSASWHPYKKHLHHDIPSRRHLHHDMPIRRHLHHKTFCISISVRRDRKSVV